MEDKEAAAMLIKSELERKAARLQAHLNNDTWTKRDNPPKDWTKPLPDFMIERNKDSYLEIKEKELREEEEQERADLLKLANSPKTQNNNSNSFCTFM